jgi:hypothetical protein
MTVFGVDVGETNLPTAPSMHSDLTSDFDSDFDFDFDFRLDT